MGAPPFTPARVTRFLLLWVLAALAIAGLYLLLTHATAREGMTPQRTRLQFPGFPASLSGRKV